jgi:MFS family permease
MSNFALFAERRFTVGHDVSHIAGTCQVRADDKLELPGAMRGVLSVDGTPLVYDRDWVIVNETTIEVRGDACARLSAARLTGRFPWSAHEVGLLFVFSGILGIIMQGGLLGRLVKKFGETKLVLAGFASAAVGYLMLGFTYTLALLLVCAAINAFGNGVLRPALTSLITQAAGRAEQGIAIGISASLSSLAMTMAPPTGGALLNHDWLLGWALVPTSVAAIGLVIAWVTRQPTPATTGGTSAGDELSSPP